MRKEFFVYGALAQIPKILTLQGPNPHNLTYGHFDRNFCSFKKYVPFIFSRLFGWENKRWKIVDDLRAKSWNTAIAAGIGCNQTSIYNVMSRTFQISQLQPWFDLISEVKKLKPGQLLRSERVL